MAYVIGSEKGKQIAKDLTVGQSYNASDGSVWTKQKDGSVLVRHNGETYSNAYTPPSGSVASSASRGGSSGGNSQYTAPTLGNTYNANTDYQAIINNAVKNGDYVTAAKAEQLRNQKINATGSNYNTTNMYSGYLNPDYGTIGQQQMANNASWQDVLDTYNSRYNKATTTAGLEQYANDEIQQMMWNYINNNMQAESQQNAIDQFNQWVQDYEQNNPKEEYNSKYDPQIDAILNEILNREDFSYDVANDPLYQQYANMYRREGDRAMKETLAEAAAGAGGMNTYAITAAQQANSYYNSQLNDRIPELYQLAYDMYLQDKESKVQDLGILQNMDATQYGRYRDTINDYYNDKNFAYGAYLDGVQQGNWQTNQNYNSLLDNRNWNNDNYWANKEWNYNDEWKNKEWDETQSDKEYDRNLYDQESAKEEVWKYIQLGVTPSADLIAKAGMTEADVNLAVAAVKAEQTKSGSKSSSKSYTYDDGGDEGDEKKKVEDDDEGYTGDEGGNVVTYEEAVKAGEDLPTALPITQTAGNFQTVVNDCENILKTKGKSAVLAYLKDMTQTGVLDSRLYAILLNKYGQ